MVDPRQFLRLFLYFFSGQISLWTRNHSFFIIFYIRFSSVQSSPTVSRNTHVQGVHNEEEKADSKRKSTAHVQRSASSVSAFR